MLLSGGVGGAKLALGLRHQLPDGALTVVANTGDDFDHLGLRICPDLDTLMYTLAGCVNEETGWGRRDDTWQCLEALAAIGAADWFRLGDRDLAVHLLRSARLSAGERLTQVTARLCAAFGLDTELLPAADEPVATIVHSDQGRLSFQEYFVRLRAGPRVERLEFAGSEHATATPEARAALADPGVTAIVLAPSNPWLSIDPILAVPGIREALRAAPAPVIAVSPIVAGRAMKGPTAKIMAELGLEVTALQVARHYQPWIDGFILDVVDEQQSQQVEALGMAAHCCNTIMQDLDDRRALAGETLDFARRCGKLEH